MGRGNDRGKDFDDQYHQSRRRGQEKQDQGRGPWFEDSQRKNAGRIKPSTQPEQKSCGKDALMILGFLSGFGWIINEIVSRSLG